MPHAAGLRNREMRLRAAGMKVAALAAVFVLPASAAHAAVKVAQPWSRPAAAGTTGVGYMTLVNKGPTADALVAVSSPLAKSAMVHQSLMAGGVSTMRHAPRVDVAPGGKVTFAQGGYHVMFVGLTRTLKVGDTLPVTLTFASGAKVTTSFVVRVKAPSTR